MATIYVAPNPAAPPERSGDADRTDMATTIFRNLEEAFYLVVQGVTERR